MTSRLLLELALGDEQSIDINSDACKRVRHRQNECQVCAMICPEQAIDFELGPVINDSCTQCGLCINACPTEVFQSKIDLEQYWLEQIQLQAGKSATKGQNKGLSLHCQQGQPRDEHSVAIHCVGSISENLLLASSLQGIREVEIHTGQCSECNLAKGVVLFNEGFNRARLLIQLANNEDIVVHQRIKPKIPIKDQQISRRAFFSNLSKGVKEKALPADYTRENTLQVLLGYEQDRSERTQQESRRRENLRKLLLAATGRVNKHSSKSTIGFLQKMQVEQEKCVACAVCVKVCPTGALEKTIENNVLYRYYSSARCTNCGLCQEACPQDIIRFSTNYTLQDIIEDNPQLVAQVKLTDCQICGETIPTIEGDICTTCQKRQITPMFF